MKSCDLCQKSYPDSLEACPEDGTSLRPATLVEPRPGAGLRAYELLEEAGRGRVSVVFKARHRDLGETHALRVLRPEFAQEVRAADELRQQAEIARHLRHPAIARIEALEEDGAGHPFLVMEYVEGPSLVAALSEPFPPRRACSIARQVTEALGDAHRLGILHRRLDPAHMRLVGGVGENQKVKVLGLGMARVTEACLRGHRRERAAGLDRLVMGAPAYASPEQSAGRPEADLDARSDLYSLGVLLYQMLSGRLPYPPGPELEGDGALGALVSNLEAPPEPLPTGLVPEVLARLVMRLLEKRREMRPATAPAVLDELGRAESELSPVEVQTEWEEGDAGFAEAQPAGPFIPRQSAPSPDEVVAGPCDLGAPLAEPSFDDVPAALDSPPRGATEFAPPSVGAPSETAEPAASPRSPADVPLAGSVLFGPTLAPSRMGRRFAKVGVALVAVAAAVWSFTVYRPRLARSTIDSIIQRYGPAPAASGQAPPAPRPQPVVTPPSAASSVSSDATQGANAVMGKPVAPAVPPTSFRAPARVPASTKSAGPAAAVPKARSVDPALVRAAIAEGDGFFELGDYDRAIAVYERPLKIDPGIKELQQRVQRARKAQAAEEKYLGQ